MTTLPLSLLLLAAQAAAPQQADTTRAPAVADTTQPMAQLEQLLSQAVVTLPGGFATVMVPPSFRYLSPEESERFLALTWNAPAEHKLLGLLLPPGVSSLEDSAGWSVVITYLEGHVSDQNAASMDYRALLRDMREGSDGELLGWVVRPEYDPEARKLVWATELDSGDGSVVEYNIRVLGRAGVLRLNAVAWMSQLAEVEQGMIELRGAVNFTDGHRYADFNEATDQIAPHGFAALVAGDAAVGGGFLSYLVNGVVRRIIYKVKKFIAAVVIAALALLWKVMTGRRREPAPAPASRPRPPMSRPPVNRSPTPNRSAPPQRPGGR